MGYEDGVAAGPSVERPTMSDSTATMDADPVKDGGAVKDGGPTQAPGPPDADESRLRLVSAIAAAVLLASLGFGITVAVRAVPQSQPTAAEPAQTQVPNWPADDIRWLLPVRPASAAVVDSLGSADHTLSLDQATAIYGDVGQSRTYLTNLGYLRGAATAWRTETPRYDVRISLLQFGAVDQAAMWAADVQRSLGAGPIESSAALGDIPGGMWFVATHTPDANYRVAHAVFHQGTIGVHMTFWCYPSVMPAVVTAIAAHQYARLPAA
jgi:hypothetical protein